MTGGKGKIQGAPASRRIGSPLLSALAAALVLLAVLAALMESRASAELERARAFVAAGDLKAADRHYFQALNWYAPWGSSQTAADELMALARSHLAAGRQTEAYHSLLRLRSALLAARSVYQPRTDLLEEATPLIALYLAQLRLGKWSPREDILELAAFYQRLYSVDPGREQSWLYLVVFSFLLWTASAFHLVFACFQEKGPLTAPRKRRDVYLPLGIFAYAYLMWLFSMRMS
jgi:tetratricopeptide (TPR) repeat protein